MGRKIKINKKMIGFISVLFMFTGIIYGCYSRDAAPQVKNIYGQNVKLKPFSEEQIRQFAGSIRKVDGQAEAHYKMALYFQERRRHKLAIDELKLALKRDPASAKAYNAIGVSFDALGDNETAISYYNQALQIDPKLDYVYNNLGYSYLLKNDMQNAVESFQQAIALNDKEKRYSNNLGLAYARQGKYELAYDQFKIQDSDANAEKMLARVMKDIGKGAEVEPVLLAVRNTPETEVLVAKESSISGVQDQSIPPGDQESYKHEEAIAEVQSETPQITVAEVKPEVLQNAVAEVKTEVPQVAVSEVKPEASQVVVAEAKPEVVQDTAAEIKPEVKEYAIAEVKPEVLQNAVAEAKPENPVNPPVVDNIPAVPVPQKAEEVQIAEVKPEVSVSASALFLPSEKKNPALGINSILVHDVKIMDASSSIQAGASQAAHGMIAAKEIEIAVENGNGVKGAAAKVAQQLRRNGFKVVKVSDARSFAHYSTKVFYDADNLTQVQQMLRVMPENPKSAEIYKMDNMGPPPIRLLIGKDMVKKQTVLAHGKKPATIKAASLNDMSKSPNLKKKKT